MASGDENISNALSYIPGGGIIDDFFGFGGRSAAKAAKKAREQQQAELDRRRGLAPTQEELTANYAMLGPSAAAGTQSDAGAIAAQQGALGAMQNVYQNQGMTDQDRAYMQQAQEQNARALRSQAQAQQQNLAERGMGNSGAGIMAMLGNQSALANANAGMAANVNYNAQDRALQAMQGAGNMAGDMRNSSFNEGFSRGTAADQFAMQNQRTQHAQEDSRVGARTQVYDNEVDTSRDQMGIYGADQADAQKRRDEAAERKRGLENKVLSTAAKGL